jgi:hypothetical protein
MWAGAWSMPCEPVAGTDWRDEPVELWIGRHDHLIRRIQSAERHPLRRRMAQQGGRRLGRGQRVRGAGQRRFRSMTPPSDLA